MTVNIILCAVRLINMLNYSCQKPLQIVGDMRVGGVLACSMTVFLLKPYTYQICQDRAAPSLQDLISEFCFLLLSYLFMKKTENCERIEFLVVM